MWTKGGCSCGFGARRRFWIWRKGRLIVWVLEVGLDVVDWRRGKGEIMIKIGSDGEDVISYLMMSLAEGSPYTPLESTGLGPRATWLARRGRLRRGVVALRS